MTGERDLQKLLRELEPQLNPGEYVFCVLQPGIDVQDAEAIGWFREQEGVTVILPRSRADEAGLSYSFVSGWITLGVHSSLEAVGLTAAVSRALTQAGISCNIVAASYHDHLFVPFEDASRALQVLGAMKSGS